MALALPQPRRRIAHPEALAQIVCARCDQAFLIDQATRQNRDREWVHEVCPAATELSSGRDRQAETVTWSARSLPSPMPPSSPLGSPDLRILRAWMEAELAHPGDQRAILAAIESAVGAARTAAARQVLGKYYYRVPEAVRPLLGRQEELGLRQLLGRWVKWARDEDEQLMRATLDGREVNRETGWIAGVAKLTEREADAYWRRIRGWDRLKIARELAPPEKRWDRSQWVSLKTVSNLCWQAKVKVLRAFGLPPSGDPDDDWPEEAHNREVGNSAQQS